MWCDKVLGNFGDVIDVPVDWVGRDLDVVDVAWDECKRMLKKKSRKGVDVRVLLPPGQRLKHGDVLFDDGDSALAVNVLHCDLAVVCPPTARAAAALGLELGNLHWPTGLGGDGEVVFPPGDEAIAVVKKLGLIAAIERRRFDPLRVSAAAEAPLADGFRVVRRETPRDG